MEVDDVLAVWHPFSCTRAAFLATNYRHGLREAFARRLPTRAPCIFAACDEKMAALQQAAGAIGRVAHGRMEGSWQNAKLALQTGRLAPSNGFTRQSIFHGMIIEPLVQTQPNLNTKTALITRCPFIIKDMMVF
jgi:hypothetical protein